MIVSKTYISNKIESLDAFIRNNPKRDNRAKKHELAFYAGIMQDMEDEGTERVQLDNYKIKKDAVN